MRGLFYFNFLARRAMVVVAKAASACVGVLSEVVDV